MDTITSLASILAILLVGVISPGPSFLLVAQTAVSQSRRAAVFSALGMGLGATFLCVLAILGLQALVRQFPLAYLVLKIVGVVYLLYLAVKLWRGASQPVELQAGPAEVRSPMRHFLVALGVMVTNPKAAVQYGILFGAFMPAHPSLSLMLLLPLCVFIMETGWYSFVAYVLSAQRSRASYLRAKRHIDRFASMLLGAMSIRVLVAR